MPDSMLYFIDKAFDNLKLFLTFDDAKKEEIITEIANERSAEYENMTVKEKQDLAQNVIKELEKLSEKLDVLEEDNIKDEVNIEHKEAVALMVEKRHELNTARQEYQAAKVDLKHAEKAAIEADITTAKATSETKEAAYNKAKDEFKIAFDAMKETLGNKEVEKTEEQANIEKDGKTEEAKEAKEAKEIKEVKDAKEVKEIKEAKEAKEAKEIKEAKDVKEVKIEVKARLANIEIKNENKREEIKVKVENIQTRNDNKKEEVKENTNEIK